jgi:hypothetical protein
MQESARSALASGDAQFGAKARRRVRPALGFSSIKRGHQAMLPGPVFAQPAAAQMLFARQAFFSRA